MLFRSLLPIFFIFLTTSLHAATSIRSFVFTSSGTGGLSRSLSGYRIQSGVPGLMVKEFLFSDMAAPVPTANSPLSVAIYRAAEADKPGIQGAPLNFPNPFRLSEGTTIGYQLTADMDMQLRIYNLVGQELVTLDLPAMQEGGAKRYNRVPITASTFNGVSIPAGLYFYFLIFQNRVLGKGKMVVVP